MRSDLPTPERILEELADKVAAQIERNAPVAFDGAWSEFLRYHRFLLSLNASTTPDGNPSSFAEVPGNSFLPPHRLWFRQYRRLFGRASDRIPDDDHFITSLAVAPNRLMPEEGEERLTSEILDAILDLGPLMIFQVQAWVTRRRVVEMRGHDGRLTAPSMAGSEITAYSRVLPQLVGSWEQLLTVGTIACGWSHRADHDDDRWTVLGRSWPLLWKHLVNTALCMAVAVWNNDEVGAAIFREALVRWPGNVEHQFQDQHGFLLRRRLLLPPVAQLDWRGASAVAGKLRHHPNMPLPSPDNLFAALLEGAHRDALLIAAATLLRWTQDSKQASDLGARTAAALLRREGDDEHRRFGTSEGIGFRSLFLNVLRLDLVGSSPESTEYGGQLDRIVDVIDGMTERDVVPGRVYTPSTARERQELRLPLLAMLVSLAPSNGDDGVIRRVSELATDEEALPGADAALTAILEGLNGLRLALEQADDRLPTTVGLLAPLTDFGTAAAKVAEVIGAARSTILEIRHQRLKAREVDSAKLDAIRSSVEAALLVSPRDFIFFHEVKVRRVGPGPVAEMVDVAVTAVAKGLLTEPPMGRTWPGLQEHVVSNCLRRIDRHVWTTFQKVSRIEVGLDMHVNDGAFWPAVIQLAGEVGSHPVLVVSRAAEAQKFRELQGEENRKRRTGSRRAMTGDAARLHIVTLDGVEIFGAEFPAGTMWLFSGDRLKSVEFIQHNAAGDWVDISYEASEDLSGTLHVEFSAVPHWDETPVYDIRVITQNGVELH